MNYKIADFNYEVLDIYGGMERLSKKYICSFCITPDFSVSITEIDIKNEYIENCNASKQYLETIAASRKFAEWLPLHNAFVLHSVAIDIDGVGVAFAAHSGTGKSTHMNLWCELLGDRVTVVNGDKPIVRFFDDEPNTPYTYGTPWCGKENLGCNMRTPMKHICFIERAEENSCEPMQATEAIDLIFNQVYMPKDPVAVVNTMQLINRFINSCSLWKIKCNMDISAAETAYKTIFP